MPKDKMKAKRKKRKTSDKPIFLDKTFFDNLYSQFAGLQWDYKVDREIFTKRDRALAAFLFLTGLRISEAIPLRKKDLREYMNYLQLRPIRPLKHGHIRKKIVLPKRGYFAKFTQLFLDWYRGLCPDDFLFPRGSGLGAGVYYREHLGRRRCYGILIQQDLFPHWLRAVHATLYGNKIFKGNAFKLREYMGWVNIEYTKAYVQASFERDLRKIMRM